MRRITSRGVTLVEVMIALAVLSVGILATVGFQVSTLDTNRRAQTINQLTRLAATEMEVRRQTAVSSAEVNAGPLPCATQVPAGFAQENCTVEIVGCGVLIAENASEFVCGTGELGNVLPFATYSLTVTAAGRGQSVSLESLYSGFYVSGMLGAE